METSHTNGLAFIQVRRPGLSVPRPILSVLLSCVFKLIFFASFLFSVEHLCAQGPNPQTGMRVIGTIKLSSSCEKDTLKMENLTKDSSKTVKYYIHNYNYFNNPIYPRYSDTFYTKDNGSHVFNFNDSMVLANCFRFVNLFFGIIAVDTFGIDYPVISRITIYLKPRALFTTDSVVCTGEELSFQNESCKDSTKFKWLFGDTTINSQAPSGVRFDSPGLHNVTMIANTSNPCAQTDTMSKPVNVLKVPEPGFKVLTPSLSVFKDSVICLGDTLYLVNTSKNNERHMFTLSPGSSFSLVGGTKLHHDTVKVVMVQKGPVMIELQASNRACDRTTPPRKLLVIQNPFVRINTLPKCMDSLWIDLDKYVDTSLGVPKKVSWTITGKGLHITTDSLFPGKLKALSYGEYFVKVISVGGCRTLTSSDSFFVSPPVKSAAKVNICFGVDSMIDLNKFHNLPKGFVRKWTGDITRDSLFNTKGKIAGIYTPTLADINSNCYSLPVTIEVIGSGSPKIPDQYICAGRQALVALDSLVPASYSGPGVSNDTFRSSIGPGTYPVKFKTVTQSCVFTDSMKIFVLDTFTPSFKFKAPGCQDSAILFQKTTPEPAVLWEFGDGTISTLDNPTHRFTKPGTFNVRLIARAHCPDSLSSPITIYPSPNARLDIVADTLGCDSVIIHATFTGKGFGENYTVRHAGDVYPGDKVRFAIAKSFQARFVNIQGTVSSNCGSKTDSARIRIPQRNYARIEILGLNPGCHGDTLKLVNLSYGSIDSFELDYGNGQHSKNKILKFPYFNNTALLKEYRVILKAYNLYCGVLFDTATYKVIPNVIRAAGEHDKEKLCSYESVAFINNCTQGTQYQLFFGDGGSSKGNVYHETVNYQYKIPGVYVPYIKAVSACGLDSMLLDTIRVNGAPNVLLSKTRSKMCLGSEIYMKYTPSNLLHPKWFVNYALADSLVNPFIFHPKTTGRYKISVLASNQFCTGLDSFEIDVESAPKIEIEVDEVTCDTLRVEISGNYTIGNLEVNWGDGVTDFAKLYHVYNDTGLYFVKITLVEGLCTLYFEREIRVKSPPVFNLLTHPRVTDCLNPGDTLNFSILTDSMPYQVDLFNWAGKSICLNCERKILDINYLNCEPKEYKIVVRDKDNCTTEKEIRYDCFDGGSNKYKAYIPNAFTPRNGDLLNNIYLPHLAYYDSGMDYRLKLYNRWGELLFETSNPADGWDGTYKGQVCPMDVYVYIIEYGCPGHRYNEHRGTLHLLR